MHRPGRLGAPGPASRARPERAVPQRVWSGGPLQSQSRTVKSSHNQPATATTTTPTTAPHSASYPLRCSSLMAQDPSDSTPSSPLQSSSSLVQQQQQQQQLSGVGNGALPVLEGPLPAEIREIIYSHCDGDTADVAERHARRLLSTNRRVRVYREELQSAVEEVGDVTQLVQRHQVVQDALRVEMRELDAKIEQLVRERKLCELQLRQEEEQQQRKESKLREANERVGVLRSTIDAITKESMAGYVLLRQLVPNLHVDNYVS
ncbi:hypothetical protein DQ04_20101010 [Trypanosoma grayi]|uniref:hypothetical protein n=1 Tax=Trypanosoma grayi TaxID=71804 RepID=UPI0004F46F5E|nr:hypothetical protein DQ04_20101010 [Trypanosoma grayi]KEG05603.1 hypothetical protein DQ04_20101010 [Trypanosoma grayi]